MGSLGCPLCCHQDFKSVGALRDHIVYFIHRPLQCEVCSVHVSGIQELTHHLSCHIGDGLPSASKVPGTQSSTLHGLNEPDGAKSPLPGTDSAEDSAAADTDGVNNSSHLSDNISNYMEGSDTANQLLKLREWQLEKLGKNFSRHRASFGKSPGRLDMSPVSGKLQKNSPLTIRDPGSDRRPTSQNSYYTTRSDLHLLSKGISSVERCDSTVFPISVYANVSSVELSDSSVCPQSVEKEHVEEFNTDPPSHPVIGSHGVHSFPLEQTNSNKVKAVDSGETQAERLPGSSKVSDPSGDEATCKNINLLPFTQCQDAGVHTDLGVQQQHRNASPPFLVEPGDQNVLLYGVQSSGNEMEMPQSQNICNTNFASDCTEHLEKGQSTLSNAENIEAYQSDRLPVLANVSSSELSPVTYPPTHQSAHYHELEPVTSQPVVYNKGEKNAESASGTADLWLSYPDSSGSSLHKSLEISRQPQLKKDFDKYALLDTHFIDIESINNGTCVNSDWTTDNDDEESFHPTLMNTGKVKDSDISDKKSNLCEENLQKATRNHTQFPDAENYAIQCSSYESQTPQDDCVGPYSVDTKPYLHKKFHHDQERKVFSTVGVDQVPDVSQYINSFQSVLVRKWNGILSSSDPMTSSICSTPKTKGEKDCIQTSQAIQVHTYKPHIKEHEREGEKVCGKTVLRKISKESDGKRKGKIVRQCDQCSKVFTKAFSFLRHQREVHAVKKCFTCVQCSKAFSSERHLQEHSGIHKKEKLNKCRHCHHVCFTASGLRTHMQEVHSNPEHRIHPCDVCGEKFAKIYGLKRHKQRKHGVQQLVCNICLKNFPCTEDLNKHRKSHLEMATLKCSTCNKAFGTSWALQRHSRSHQVSPQRFKCNTCNCTFMRKDSLVSHLYAHAQKKSFTCHCGKRFVRKSQLKEHQDKHSTVPRHTCPVCRHSFKFKVSLKNHSCKKKSD